MPFKWYPGARAAARGARLATARPRGGAGRPDRPRDRDEVPVLRDPPSEQGRLARPPVPPGVRPRPNRVRTVRGGAVRPRDRSGDPPTRPCGARRGEAALRDLEERRRPARALDRPRRGSARPAAAAARVPVVERRRGEFILSVGRLDRAKRVDLLLEAAALETSLRVVVAGEGRTASASSRLRAAAASTGASVRGPGGRRRARRSLCRLPGGLLRADRRGLRLSSRTRRSCRRSRS